jgi:hypothetical protein
VHQQRSQIRCHFSQTALQQFNSHLRLWLEHPDSPRIVIVTPRLVVSTTRHVVGAPRLVTGTSRLVAGTPRCYQVYTKIPSALRGVAKLITNTHMVCLYQSLELPWTPMASPNALFGSDTLLKLTHLSLHSTSSQTLLEGSSD